MMSAWRWCATVLSPLFLVAALLAFGLSSAVQAFETRAGLHDTYGRLVFDWGVPVKYNLSVSGTTATMTFDKPVEKDPSSVTKPIRSYVDSVSLSPDMLVVTMVMKEPWSVRVLTVGTAIAVDFSKDMKSGPQQAGGSPKTSPAQPAAAQVPPSSAGAGGGSPPVIPAASPPVEADRGPSSVQPAPPEAVSGIKSSGVEVSVSSEPGGVTRIALDWPQRQRYTVQRGDGKTTVTFPRTATIDIASLRSALPESLKNIAVEEGRGRLAITVPVPPRATLMTAADGKRVLIDIKQTGGETSPATSSPDSAAAATVPDVPAANVPPTEVAASPPAGKAATDTEAASPSATTTPPPPPSAAVQALEQAMRDRLGLAKPAPPPPPPSSSDSDSVQVEEGRSGDAPVAASLSFPWNEPAAAAVFRRSGWTWVVFDRPKEMDLGLLRRLGSGVVREIEQIPSRSATVIRMLVEPGYNPSVRREGLLWVVDLLRQPWRPANPTSVEAQPKSPVGPRLFVPVAEGGRAMVLEDPEVGDRFIVVPLVPLGIGIFPAYSFPDVDIPVTVQGILVEPKSDRIVVNSTRNGVDVTARGGLTFSPDLAQAELLSSIGTKTDFKKVLDIDAWMHGPEEDFSKNRKQLQIAVASTPPARRNNARLDLARFFFAHGRAAEALGILKVLADDDKEIVNTGAFRALRGVSSFLMGRYPEAIEDLEHASLKGVEEAAFWRAAAQVEMGDPGLQAQALRAYGGVIGNYPQRVKIPLALTAAKATVSVSDEIGTNTFLTAARSDHNTQRELAAINYIEGKLSQSKGNFEIALERFADAIETGDRYYSAVASYDRLMLQKKIEEIDTETLVNGLERLRYAWRGGAFEFNLLMTLGDLERDRGRYGEALRIWQQAATYFQDYREAEKATASMRDAFESLFLKGAADSMSPVGAIALYDEFRELTPTGEKGDEMIRRLADRLVGVDLLSQAASLLDRQVTYRLGGVEKSRVGARLALVNLLDKQPQKAVEALLKTADPATPEPLEAQRQRLLARALSDMGRGAEAIDLLGLDTSTEADLLRTEIYWKEQNWPAVAQTLEKLTPEPESGLVLTDTQARLLLDWATALTLAQDERGIMDLRKLYMPAMKKTSYHTAFDLITTTPEGGLIDYRTVSGRIRQAENFRSFMAGYEEKLKSMGLSTIN